MFATIKLSTSLLTKNHLDKYQCPKCEYLLKDAVQTSCGHWLCRDCAEDLFKKEKTPTCLEADCGEELTNEEGQPFFPDRFVRKEIGRFSVNCPNGKFGCDWLGPIADYYNIHIEECTHEKNECPHCNLAFSPVESHKSNCPQAPVECPLKDCGCVHDKMTKDECVQHLTSQKGIYEHFLLLAKFLLQSDRSNSESSGEVVKDKASDIEVDGPPSSMASFNASTRHMPCKPPHDIVPDLTIKLWYNISPTLPIGGPYTGVLPIEFSEMVNLVMSMFTDLQTQFKQLELSQQSKHTENEDRGDFRLSLMENCNYDGTMVWKIPQFSQRMDDARTGKYTSIFSLPFYSNRYGYKMCLRLYILGDGIGKGSHMSLFLVVMKGKFDNILQWPFTHKVTFKLINQCGGRDIIDIFQPDPLSSSFQKPESCMNIASGCPRFVSLSELTQEGYMKDDTVFITVIVDTSTMRHPIECDTFDFLQ